MGHIGAHHRTRRLAGQTRHRRGHGRLAALVLVATAAGLAGALSGAQPAAAADACGLPELQQNVFRSGSAGEGDWTNPLMWSRGHLPAAGDVNVCVPGGTVALVRTNIDLLSSAVGYVTTLRIEGTIRVQNGATAYTNGAYGGTNLINGGVIQVIGGARLNMWPDQNGAPAFQNVGNTVGGGQILVQGAGSSVYLARPLLNNGTIDLTGGGTMYVANSSISVAGYSGTGSVVGGKLSLLSGIVDYTDGGPLHVLGRGGGVSGTIGTNQSLDVSCDTSAGVISIFGHVVNNGVVRLRPPTAGTCGLSMSFNPQAGGSSFTNNGRFEIGDAADLRGFGSYGTSPYAPGTFVNGASGTVVLHDTWTDGSVTTNNGVFTIAPTGTFLHVGAEFDNNGSFVNNNGCQVRILDNAGLVDLVENCAVQQRTALSAASTLRLHADSTGITKLTGGDRASSLGGTLDVVTDASRPPAVGTISDILETSATGAFANVTSATSGYTYGAMYPATGRPRVSLLGFSAPGLTALSPGRVLDTRSAGTTIDGQSRGAGLQRGGSTIELVVAGRGGVPGDAAAAVLNVTVTEPEVAGFVTVWPCGSDRPNASSLNYGGGDTVANGVIAKIGSGGKVCLFVSSATQVLADVAGYFSATAYDPIVPGRVLDSRPTGTTTDGQSRGGGFAAAGTVTAVKLTDRAGVPTDATAAVLNVTVTESAGPGFVTVYPCGSPRPNASSLNYATGSTVANNVIAKIGDGGTICLFSSQTTHLVVDVGGYFRPGASFAPLVPGRLLDTRIDGATVDGLGKGAGLQSSGSIVEIQATGRAGVSSTATAAVLNVTVTDARGAGFVTVWPCGAARPTASSLNFAEGLTVANGVIAKVGLGGKVCVFVSNGTHVVADVAGYFTS